MNKKPRSREPSQKELERAHFYAQTWVIPLLQVEPTKLTAALQALTQQDFDIPHSRRTRVSESTLWRLLRAYQAHGLEGLYRQPRTDTGKTRVLPAHILRRAIEMRQDLPSRSAWRILKMLKKEFPDEIHLVKPTSLSAMLTKAGHPRIKPKRREKASPKKARYSRMQWERPLQLVQSDVCGQTLWVTENGERCKASLVAVLDHCSKRARGQWVLRANLPALERCINGALQDWGVFARLHVDRGKIYDSYLLKHICSEFGIDLKYARGGYAPGKGGIERFWRTVEEDFILEIGDSTRLSLAQLNDKYRAWEYEYNRKPHSTTEEPPLERFERLAADLRYPDPDRLYQASLLRESRQVNKRLCTVAVRTQDFLVQSALAGKTVQVRYDPWNLAEVWIYDRTGSHFLQVAQPLHPNARPEPFLPEAPAHRTPAIDGLVDAEAEYAAEQARHHVRGRPARPKVDAFAAFCQALGQLLKREAPFPAVEASLLHQSWDQYGPFPLPFVNRALEPMIARCGVNLHLSEYLKTLVEARLRGKERRS